MKPELRNKWVAGLLSGDYKQIRGLLRSHRGYCCIAVLMAVSEMSLSQLEKRGLFSAEMDKLFTEMNDIDQLSFDEIAYYIEDNL